MRDRFYIGRAAYGLIACAHAVIASEREQPGFAEMIGQQFRFARSDVAKTLFQSLGDAPVPFATAHQQQAFIGGVTHQRVLEDETPIEAALLGEYDSRGHQLCQHVFELAAALAGNRFQHFERELPTDDCGNLSHLACAAETVEAGH